MNEYCGLCSVGVWCTAVSQHCGVSQYTAGKTHTHSRSVKMGTGFTGAGAV
jgi:hypothetical protein